MLLLLSIFCTSRFTFDITFHQWPSIAFVHVSSFFHSCFLLSLFTRNAVKWKRSFIRYHIWTSCKQPSSIHKLIRTDVIRYHEAEILFKYVCNLEFHQAPTQKVSCCFHSFKFITAISINEFLAWTDDDNFWCEH